jgi:hypothetical protein
MHGSRFVLAMDVPLPMRACAAARDAPTAFDRDSQFGNRRIVQWLVRARAQVSATGHIGRHEGACSKRASDLPPGYLSSVPAPVRSIPDGGDAAGLISLLSVALAAKDG